MSSVDTTPRDVKAIIDRYRTIGLFGGLLLGGIAGVMIAGPNFREWSWMRSLVTIVGSLGVGALLGYIAGEIAVAGLAGGPGGGGGVASSGTEHSSSVNGLDASGGGDGGGGGGDS